MLNNLGAGGHRDLAGGVLGAVLLSPRLLPSVRQSETEVRAGVHSTKYSSSVCGAGLLSGFLDYSSLVRIRLPLRPGADAIPSFLACWFQLEIQV